MSETALDRLNKESQAQESEKYTVEDIVEETAFLNGMSEDASSALKEKLQPVELDDSFEEEYEEDIEDIKKEEPKEEIKKEETKKPAKKAMARKKDKVNAKYDSFMNSLANECIDIMIQSGTTIHGFNNAQMNLIWDYIKERLN